MSRLKKEYKDPNSMRGRARKFDPEFYRKRPTQVRVRDLFEYKEDGTLARKVLASKLSRAKVGERVRGGVCTSGYYQIYVDGIYYFLHQIIWVWHHGYWPENQIDHIDRVRTNNKIENLREVSQTCNSRNSSLQSRNSVGVKGVGWHKRDCCWTVNIRVAIMGGLKHLGYFKDLTEAVAHRYAAEQCLDWHQCDTTSSAYQYLKQQGVLK